MKHYTQKELEHGGDFEEEQKRLRIIFEDLKQKAPRCRTIVSCGFGL